MQNVKKLFYTTIALTLTSFLMKTIAVWFNVYLTELVGSVGMGIFQLILSVYALSKTLACGGMALSATRLCIDDFENARHSMRRLLFCALLLGLSAFSLLFSLSDFLSRQWIMTEKAAPALKILSLSLPFISLSAALNGYMTAARKMSRYSVIQLLEQLTRITATIFIIKKMGNTSAERTLGLVSVAITLSEVVSFSLAAACFVYDIKKEKMQKSGKRGFFKRMARLVVPDAIGSYIRSGLNTIEHLLIPRGIRKSGANLDRAFSDYGIVQGMALPILLYPSSILGVVSGLLIPEIAECKLKKNTLQQNYIINRVLHVAMIFSMITTSVMLIFSEELSLLIYKNADAAYFIRLIAPLIPIMYLDMTTDGMLKGLDKQLDIMKINVIDSVLCVFLVWILVPKISVDGYIITIYVAEIINFILSFKKLSESSHMRFGFIKNFIKPLVCSLSACILIKYLPRFFPTLNFGTILSIVLGLIIYLIFLKLCRGITSEDISWFLSLITPKRKKNPPV